MKNFFLLLVLLFFSKTVSSQEFQLTGKVENTQEERIAFANVLLLHAKDSTVLDGTSSDENGFFFFDKIKKGVYFVQASFVANSSEVYAVSVNSDVDMGILLIDETTQNLDEVIVTYQKPKLERKIDRLVFNVANTAIADGTIWDLLKHTPTVNDIQGVLTVKGSSNIIVMINGRKVNLPQNDIINLLSGASASNVDSIEVITNPPSKYSAEGGMIIDIKMNKNLIAGYNGALFNRYRQGVFAKHSLGTDHYFKGSKSDFALNYSYGREKNIRRHKDVVNFFEQDNTFSTWTSIQDYLRRIERHGLNVSYNYQFNEKSSLALSTINSWNPNNSRLFDTKTSIQGAANNFFDFNTINNSGENTLNTSFYANYLEKLDDNGKEIAIGTHYTFFKYGRIQDLKNDFLDPNGTILSTNNLTGNSNNRINLYSARLDYQTSIGKLKVETGIRFAGISSESTNEQTQLEMSQIGGNFDEVDRFNYNESIYAAYVSFNGKKGNWTYKGGLRSEYTKTSGVFDSDLPDIKNDYLNLFPSFSLQYSPSGDNDFRLWYYRRISRPRFVIANPFQYFQTNNSVYEGNPNILPSTRHYVAASYNFQKSYTFEIFYRNQNNPIQQLVLQDNENKTLLFQQANFIKNESYGFDFIYDKNILNFWNAYLYLSIYDRKFNFIDGLTNNLITNGLWTWSFEMNNSFTFSQDKNLFIDVSFYYYSDEAIANTIRQEFSAFNISARKVLWNKKATISIGVQDIFNQNSTPSIRRYSDQNNISDYRFESRLFTFAFRYKFGNTGIKTNRNRKRIDERNRL